MKKIIFALALLLSIGISKSNAQQDGLYSHYIFNELISNPAYSGSKEMLSVSLLYRSQWVNFEGAPKTFTFGIHGPLKNKNMALGGSIIQDKITVFNNTTLNLMYSYHVPITKKIKLSIGLQGTLLFENVDLARLDAFNGETPDQAFLNIKNKSFHPNFGAGMYLYGKDFSFGVGVPHMLLGKWIDNNRMSYNQVNHYFVTGSYTWDINKTFKVMPTVAMRFTQNSPFQIEGNLNAIILERVMVGAGYRTDKSAIFMLNYFHLFNNGIRTNEVRFGYSYDLSWKPLRNNSNGSHEILLTFGLTPKNERHISPRFF